MQDTAFQPYYQNSHNEYLSLGAAGVGVWTAQGAQSERWLSPKEIRRLTKTEAASQNTQTALKSEEQGDQGEKMFDTLKVGQRIAVLRKAKDMTQMELADKMMVSYQAVSNWERGNSMPDISKLADLSEILGVTMEELLGSKREAEILEKLTQNDEALSLDEVAQVAPILKPSILDELVTKEPGADLKIKNLVELAPYFNKNRLSSWAEGVQVQHLSELLGLAPFIHKKTLSKLLRSKNNIESSLQDLVVLAPFLEREDLSQIIQDKLQSGADFSQISALAPFLEEEDLEKLLESADPEKLDGGQLAALAPFMEGKALGRLINKIPREAMLKQLDALAPFMESEDLTPIAREILKAGDLHNFKKLLPFIDTYEL